MVTSHILARTRNRRPLALVIAVMLALLAAVLLGQGTPPPQILRDADALRRIPGADLRVENEDGVWQIWLDVLGTKRDDDFLPLHDIRGLTALRLMSGEFSDKAVAHLRNLPDLWLLVLISPKLTDASLISISKLKALKKLDLNRAKLSLKGLTYLSDLPKLEQLYLYNARLTDGDLSINALKRLTQLKILDLPPSVSDNKLRELRKALPNTSIERR